MTNTHSQTNKKKENQHRKNTHQILRNCAKMHKAHKAIQSAQLSNSFNMQLKQTFKHCPLIQQIFAAFLKLQRSYGCCFFFKYEACHNQPTHNTLDAPWTHYNPVLTNLFIILTAWKKTYFFSKILQFFFGFCHVWGKRKNLLIKWRNICKEQIFKKKPNYERKNERNQKSLWFHFV